VQLSTKWKRVRPSRASGLGLAAGGSIRNAMACGYPICSGSYVSPRQLAMVLTDSLAVSCRQYSDEKEIMKKTFAAAGLSTAMLCGCVSGGINYTKPQAAAEPNSNSIVVAKSRDAVWATAIPNLGKHFFVINTMDKSSGLINVSYSGDPERYVDCGRIHTDVTNARGPRSYDFSGSAADKRYEFVFENRLYSAHRKMSLDGRVNLIFEVVDASHTRITASTQYIVHKQFEVQMAGSTVTEHSTDSVSFTSGGSAAFPNSETTCAATGALESQLLTLLRE
jgi:hypothetical protein